MGIRRAVVTVTTTAPKVRWVQHLVLYLNSANLRRATPLVFD